MTVSRSTTARELGAALRRHRNAAGLTLRQLEALVGHSNAKISMWENGHRLPPLDDLEHVLDALNVVGDDHARLLSLRREAEGPGRLLTGVSTIGPRLAELIKQEQAARRIVDVAPLLIPGLLQTSGYARAILGRYPDADTRVALRMGRRDILTRPTNPVEFHALIDEEVLARRIIPPALMREQLQFLLRMAELPNVTIQLMPSVLAEFTPMLDGPFILMEFATATSTVHLEHHSASATLWEEKDVRRFYAAVEWITNAAMTPEHTSEVIAELIHAMEKNPP